MLTVSMQFKTSDFAYIILAFRRKEEKNRKVLNQASTLTRNLPFRFLEKKERESETCRRSAYRINCPPLIARLMIQPRSRTVSDGNATSYPTPTRAAEQPLKKYVI